VSTWLVQETDTIHSHMDHSSLVIKGHCDPNRVKVVGGPGVLIQVIGFRMLEQRL